MNFKKFLAVVLSLILVMSTIPFSATVSATTDTVSTSLVSLEGMPIVDHGSYQGNQGDSTVYNLNGKGLSCYDKGERFSGCGNVGIDGTTYTNGFEVWIARWNYKSEISWAFATFKLDGKYQTLTGKTNLIYSPNTTNFDTTVYFYSDDILLASYNLTDSDYMKDIEIDITGVVELKLYVKDNVKVKGGTSFALYDMFLENEYTNTFGIQNGLAVYSDHTNLSIKNNTYIMLGSAVYIDGERVEDISGITFSISDTSILTTSYTTSKDNCFFVKLKGIKSGTAYVTFSDSETGYLSQVPITVFEGNYQSFTLNSVPTQNIDKYETNFYNFNGLYIDSYDYTVNDNKTVNISFDVYNSNNIYGFVEIYDSFGKMKNAIIIDKMTNNAGSIKAALWDNTGCLIRDVFGGDLFTYRQESGFTKRTQVSVEVPEGGYIKITTDPQSSFLVGLINSIDILMSISSLAGDVKNFDVNSKEFTEKITYTLVQEAVFSEMVKDGDQYSKQLLKNIGKESIVTSSSLGNFADTISKNIGELNIGKIISDTAMDFGWNIGENLFEFFSGPVGNVLNGMFLFGDLTNIIMEKDDYIKSVGSACITIQNQGGGMRAASQITVKSQNNFTDDTALNVFKVTPDTQLLTLFKSVAPEVYKEICSGLTHTYNISMIKNGIETQLESDVDVYIQIPDNLKLYAYTGKVKIYRVENDDTLTEMDAEIVDGCFVFKTEHFSLYTIIGYDKNSDKSISDILDYSYMVLDDDSIEIIGYTGDDEYIKIPNLIDGYVVNGISDNCFSGNEILKNLVIPDSIKNIGDYAFGECKNLSNIIIPDSVKTIGKEVFFGCSNLTIYCNIGNVSDILSSTEYTYKCFGDFDDDKILGSADTVKMRKSLLGLYDENYDEMIADVNQDSSIDILDLIRLKKNIAEVVA